MKYIRITCVLFFISILFVAYSVKASAINGSVVFDAISLPALSVAVEMSTQIKTTTNSQYYYNSHTGNGNGAVKIMLRKGNTGTVWKTISVGTTAECPDANLYIIRQTGTFTIYGKNARSSVLSIHHDGIWYFD